jgi:hypothetical protein
MTLCALVASPCAAQRAGGHAAASLRTPLFAQEIALGGLHVPFAPNASALFTNSSALGWLERPSASAAWASGIFGIGGTIALGATLPVTRFASVGLGVTSMSSGDQAEYVGTQRVGTFVDRELTFVTGGSLAIGPGSVGATVRLLRRDITGHNISNTGYAVDLSGSIAFDDRIYASFAMANVAGELISGETTLRERIPWEARVNGAYVHPLEERSESARIDPSGTVVTRRQRPKTYLLAAVGSRLAQHDSMPSLSVGVEAVPLASVELGLRLGVNSIGEFSGGFLYRVPVEFTRELRVDYAIRWYESPTDISHHLGVTAEF